MERGTRGCERDVKDLMQRVWWQLRPLPFTDRRVWLFVPDHGRHCCQISQLNWFTQSSATDTDMFMTHRRRDDTLNVVQLEGCDRFYSKPSNLQTQEYWFHCFCGCLILYVCLMGKEESVINYEHMIYCYSLFILLSSCFDSLWFFKLSFLFFSFF